MAVVSIILIMFIALIVFIEMNITIALIEFIEMIIIIAFVKRLNILSSSRAYIGVGVVAVAMRDSLVARVLFKVFIRAIVLVDAIVILESRWVWLVTTIARKIHVSLNCVVIALKAR